MILLGPPALVVALLLVLAAAGPMWSQTGTVSGVVRDSTGAPIADAQLALGAIRTTSDSLGRYQLSVLPLGPATLRVRRVGYAPVATTIDIVDGARTLDVDMRALAGMLPGVVTLADATDRLRLADFYRHREGGTGIFLTRREIEATKAMRTSDILRRMPGMRIGVDRAGRQQLRMTRSNCVPDYWIDGQRAPVLHIDDIPLQDIGALEIYRGESGMPPEFNSRGNRECGAVVIWTRPPR